MIMATEYKLSYTAVEIDERLNKAGNAVLFTEQLLTEEQKARARANIGVEIQEESTTTKITYAYDGDKDSKADAVWISIGSGGTVYFKLADLPDGKLNMSGSTVSVINRPNSYQNAYVEITEEKLEEVVTCGGVEVAARVNGFTQVFAQILGESNPITTLIICEAPGKYKVALNGWSEELSFKEPGIYFLEQQPVLGQKYTSEFTTSYTTFKSGLGSTPVKYTGNEIQVFSRGLCIGDSITVGTFNHSEEPTGGIGIKKYSYPAILKRMTGIDIVNSGIGGATSKSWYMASLDGDTLNGRWINGEWVWDTNPTVSEGETASQALDYSGFDFAIIHMGINDVFSRGSASIEEVASAYETYIGSIVSRLKSENKGIKIFIATIIPCYAFDGHYEFEVLNAKIKEIAEATPDAYLVDLNLYSDCKKGSAYENEHLTAIGYHKMATELSAYISYIIKTNIEEFKEIQFIGTSHRISNEEAQTLQEQGGVTDG